MAEPKPQEWHPGVITYACPFCPYDSPEYNWVAAHMLSKHEGMEAVDYSKVELSIEPVKFDCRTVKAVPLISCIMVTKNRHKFAAAAIEMFKAQTYPNKELIIVDDSEPLFEPSVQYSGTIGAKRNKACQVAKGEWIAIWDDDEWQSPNRLALQWAEIDASVDLIGICRPIFGVVDTKELYVFGGCPPSSAWCSGSTMMFRKSSWERNRFIEVNVGEDQAFLQGIPQRRVRQMQYFGFNVSFVHSGNTVTKDITKAPYVRHFGKFPIVE